MRRSLMILPILAVLIVSGGVAASTGWPKGYLTSGEFDVTTVLEPAPRPGDPRYQTDRAIFRDTRRFVGTPRYALATADAVTGIPALMHDYSCAVGVNLTPENAPKLAHLMQRATADTGGETNKAKEFYQRQRPFMIDKGQICQPQSELYDQKNHRMSYDYPSGHTTNGWTWALVLSSIAPDRAQAILERGRAYGDSRFLCGAHNESAVEAGMLSASATMALVQTKPEYEADRADAKAELDALRVSGPKSTGCDAETALIHMRVMPKVDAAH